jgi:hypothetical protein
VKCSTMEEVVSGFTDYFQAIFTTSNSIGIGDFIAALKWMVNDSMNVSLMKEYTKEEVCVALSQMGPLKSPAPDGLPTAFYQEHWPSIGDEVCNMVLNFLNLGVFGEEVNHTYIALIPKMKVPMKASDFRPISLYIVLYKIISKTLANRLKIILKDIISPNQNVFVLGRLISDNIIVTYETMHSMQTRMWGKVGSMALKLDMKGCRGKI